MASVCPRCSNPRDQRDGPYFVCPECRWCWTVSITGTVYVQADWPRRSLHGDAEAESEMPRRLLASVDGLTAKLSQPWPPARLPSGEARLKASGFDVDDIARLKQMRAATHADFFNEGLPFTQLREAGIQLGPSDELDPSH